MQSHRSQAIFQINAGILLIRTLRTNFNEILSQINKFSFQKMHLSQPECVKMLISINDQILTFTLFINGSPHIFKGIFGPLSAYSVHVTSLRLLYYTISWVVNIECTRIGDIIERGTTNCSACILITRRECQNKHPNALIWKYTIRHGLRVDILHIEINLLQSL